jgi:6-pyruvoyltetrahydropterin/6-carboxytetrahydropterin synthase
MEIFTCFTFDSAHKLPKVPKEHKCGRLHGHTFNIQVHVSGPIDPKSGWVVDFGDLKALVNPLVDQLDHNYLNEIKGLENPTSENIARWLWERIKPKLPILTKIVVQESPRSGASYQGEKD